MAFIRPTSTYFAGGAPGGPFPLQPKKKQTACTRLQWARHLAMQKPLCIIQKIWPRTNVKVRNKQMLLRNRREEHKERIYSGGFVVCRCTRCIAGICGQQTAVYDWPPQDNGQMCFNWRFKVRSSRRFCFALTGKCFCTILGGSVQNHSASKSKYKQTA